ncbi:MAG: hypothetical protein KAY65_00505 [Planctomycetes bacterium]|nr:hypothetical protein [Planctomycetota bacterium]
MPYGIKTIKSKEITNPVGRTVPAGDINKDRIVNFLDLCIVAEQWMAEE